MTHAGNVLICRWLTKKNSTYGKTGGRHQHQPWTEVTQGKTRCR